MSTSFELSLLLGAIAAALTLSSNLMKRMVPLRILALAATAFFFGHYLLAKDWINSALQVALMVVNLYRLWDLQRLLKSLKGATVETPVKDWLLPYMTKKAYKAGDVVFRKGEAADHMVYIQEGTVRVEESGQTLGAGSLIGEIGLFSEARTRTATVVCETNCVGHTMTDEAIHLLYVQNPKLGFYLIRLIAQRLLQDLQRGPGAAGA